MTILGHLLLFLLSGAVIWLSAGRLIETVDKLARRFKQSGFTVAFFILGFLTSVSELSVMVNSTISGAPQISAGNLAGASIVLLLFLVPLTAIMGNGIRLDNTLNRTQLALALFATALPTLLLLDGGATWIEGLVCLLAYGSLLFLVRRRGAGSLPEDVEEVIEDVIEGLADDHDPPLWDALQIIGGAVLIFVAGNFLVEETIYFSGQLNVPSSLIGLLVLSIGTNVPEIVIAVRSVRKGRAAIAFGNYIGSSLANAVLFGLLVLLNGSFAVEGSEFVFTAILMAVGFTAFYVFARSQNRISRFEGQLLVLLYAAFVLLQVLNQARVAAE